MSCVAVAAPTNTAASPMPVSEPEADERGDGVDLRVGERGEPDEQRAAAEQDAPAVAVAEAARPTAG